MGKVGRPRKNPSPSSSDIAHHHFFKVYIPSISSHDLKISLTFVKKINGVVPQKVILRDPRGRLWNVETKKVKGAYYFENGWREFVENNFLKLGEFLVFRYMGNSFFDVMILDNSGCDKEYNVDANLHKLSKDKPDEDMEESFSSKPVFVIQEGKKLGKEEEQEINEQKQVQQDDKEEEDLVRELTMHQKQDLEEEEQQDEQEQEQVQYEKQGLGEEELVREEQELKEKDQGQEEKQGQELDKCELGLEKDMLSNAASASTDLAQPTKTSFIAIYKPWRPYYLHIPKKMITSNNIKLKPEMLLRDPSRKLWPVRICFRKDGRITITKGWWTFRKGNNLTQHDKCIFEFNHNKGRGHSSNVINVNIVRATTPGESSLRSLQAQPELELAFIGPRKPMLVVDDRRVPMV